MSKSENSLMYESYLNQAGNAINQQADYGKDKYRPGLGKSNINQFSGLMGRGKPNAAGISNWSGGPSDEEIEDDELIEVRGFGVVRLSQLRSMIERKSAEISQSIADDNLNVTNKADLLKLFSQTYEQRNNI